MAFLALFLVVGASLAGMVGLSAAEIDSPDAALDDDNIEQGNDNADTLSGDSGNELLIGWNGGDALSGNDGHDWLLGLNGDDHLSGGDGADVLIGGAGQDTLIGGAGGDFIESANIVDEAALLASIKGADNPGDLDFGYALPGTSDDGDIADLGPGDDTIVAGSDDSVTGGSGADEFVLGDWIEGGRPVVIEDFDIAEDLISFMHADDQPTPDMTLQVDAQTGLTSIKADGQTVAVVRNASPDFSLRNVAVGRYAA
ncbi:calcium-binding protein [Roseovarius gahaiensis]|uniref:Calcium-binding protein n=1 Tax=Roseovarius gahaiensis TaxID=2716691 RepID=A0A967BBF1_9RHOB|nr:calcium-binding protein [Roseovarius gahaiensis]NHQ72996.1 calcium-binding protein [Roseovarius gahaiensis]